MDNSTDNLPEFAATQTYGLSWYDFMLFAGLLGLSTAIGLYFGCRSNKPNTVSEYLLGGRKMTFFPISMSLIASQISSTTMITIPADIYLHGTNYCWSLVSVAVALLMNFYVFLPVFMHLKTISIFEYLELRFHRRVRTFSSILNFLFLTFYLPIVIYVPALALAQGTNLNVHLITPVISGICIFYTMIGGLKAVVWTDTLQFFAMIGSIVVVVFVGINNSGGLQRIFEISKESDRLDVDLDVSPFNRDSMWSVLIGVTVQWFHMVCLNPCTVQKLLSLENKKEIKRSLIIFGIGEILLKGIIMFTGLIMLTHYYHCDPITSHKVKRPDALLPYYIMDIGSTFPGLSGLFISGVFCATISTMSTILNCSSGYIYEDFISPYMPPDINEKTINRVLKLIVLIVGIVCSGLILVIERLGGLFPVIMSIGGSLSGPMLGIFMLGILVPRANTMGAMSGGLCSGIIALWMMVGSQLYKAQGYLQYETKHLNTDSCLNFTSVPMHKTSVDNSEVSFLYRITFYYYTLIGTVIVLIVGIPVSYFTCKDAVPVDRKLLSPLVHFLLPKEEPPEYYSIQKLLNPKNCEDAKENDEKL